MLTTLHQPKSLSNARRRQTRGGFAMLIVMVVLIAMLGMAAVHQRRLSAALRIEEAVVAAEARNRGPLFALAQAIEVTEAGPPLTSPAVYGMQFIATGEAQPQDYLVTYTWDGSRWTVVVVKVDDASGLTPLPVHF